MTFLYNNNEIETNDFLEQGKIYNAIKNNILVDVKYYAKDDSTDNIDDFFNLINVCNYWMIDYDFSTKEGFIKDNIIFLIYNLHNLHNIPEEILLICLKYCNYKDFPIFYNFYHNKILSYYHIINYIKNNEQIIIYANISNHIKSQEISMITIKEEDIILAQNINLYIDLLNEFKDINNGDFNDYTIFKKYPHLNQTININYEKIINVEKSNEIILGYLITLINSFDMNYKIIINNETFTLFTYFMKILKSYGVDRVQGYVTDSVARLYKKVGVAKRTNLVEIKL